MVRFMKLLTRDERPPGEEPVSDLVPELEVSRAKRVRVLLAAACAPLLFSFTAIAAVLAAVSFGADRSRFSASGALLAAGPGWLASWQVELDLGGHPLGVLPLLPTLFVGWLVARAAARAARRGGGRTPADAIPVVTVIAGAHALFGVLVALLAGGSPVDVNALTAFCVPGLLAGLAAIAGVARVCGLPASVRDRFDPVAIQGLRAGALGLAALIACGAVVFTAATALSWSTVDSLFEPGFGASFGLFVLSVAYLPNAVVAALSFTTGPGFSVGSLTVGMFGYQEGQLPGVPVLAGVPSHHAVWWPALLLLPALVGALVGWRIRAIDEDPMLRMRAVAVAGALVAFGCVILGTLAGGRLGDGPFDPVSVPVGVASVIAFCWIVVPGGFVAFFAGAHEAPEPPGEPEVEDSAEAGEEPVESEAEEPAEEPEAELDEEFDEEVEEELARELGEDLDETPAEPAVEPEPEPEPEQDIAVDDAVTESTDGSGDESAPGDDR
ncbi:cell division protein PerM [Amycolatopsis lurida]|uniref:cell division protein PerM n=1 Tax=Amycolatopsis lurida TaxID=31959 RepID=UPI0036673700